MKICISSMCYSRKPLNYQYISKNILTLMFFQIHRVVDQQYIYIYNTGGFKVLEKFHIIKTKMSHL